MRAERFRTVCAGDDAIDTEQITAAEMYEFCQSRDFSIVEGKWLADKRPTIFHLREIPQSLVESYVMAVAGTEDEARPEKFRRAFECAVYAVENLMGNDGVCIDKWEPTRKRNGVPTMSKEESFRFSVDQRQEIGMVAFEHAFLHRAIALDLPLQSFVVARLDRRVFRPAEPNQSTASVQSNDKPSPAAEEVQATA